MGEFFPSSTGYTTKLFVQLISLPAVTSMIVFMTSCPPPPPHTCVWLVGAIVYGVL